MKSRTTLIRVTAWIAVALAAAAALLFRTWARVGQPAGAERAAYTATSSATLPELWATPTFSVPNQLGASLSDHELRDEVWIADFIFTTCTAVCPRITASMVQLQHQLTDPRLRFVSFSVDPVHDTVPALAAYKQLWNPNDTRWHLLRPNASELQAIAAGMRVALEPTGDATNPILHSNLFFLVDGAGKVRGVYDSHDSKATERLIVDARSLLATAGAAPVASVEGLQANTGAQLYTKLGCAACHDKADLAPSLVGLSERSVTLTNGTRVRADRAYIERSLLEPSADVVQGYLQLMPSYANELKGDGLRLMVDFLLAGVPPSRADASPAASAGAPSAASTSLPLATDAASSKVQGKGDPSQSAPASASRAPTAEPSATAQPNVTTEPAVAVHKDPVCDMEVRASANTPHATHDGKTYFFCSPICRERFTAEPGKYTQKK